MFDFVFVVYSEQEFLDSLSRSHSHFILYDVVAALAANTITYSVKNDFSKKDLFCSLSFRIESGNFQKYVKF